MLGEFMQIHPIFFWLSLMEKIEWITNAGLTNCLQEMHCCIATDYCFLWANFKISAKAEIDKRNHVLRKPPLNPNLWTKVCVLKTAHSNPKSTLDMISTSHPHIIKQASKPFAYTTVQRKTHRPYLINRKEDHRSIISLLVFSTGSAMHTVVAAETLLLPTVEPTSLQYARNSLHSQTHTQKMSNATKTQNFFFFFFFFFLVFFFYHTNIIDSLPPIITKPILQWWRKTLRKKKPSTTITEVYTSYFPKT